MDDLKKISQKKKKDIYCGNCGKFGHTYKKCTEAITSLGIILYRVIKKTKIEFLLIQRKDSIGYVEFIRGRYKLNEIDYLKRIFSEMTYEEISRIKKYDFNKLWEELWMTENNKQYKTEYENSKIKFDELKKGYLLDNEKINIEYIITLIDSFWKETEWGFPKGRRNLKESNINKILEDFFNEILVDLNLVCRINRVLHLYRFQ